MPAPPDPLLASLRAAGQIRRFATGEFLFCLGERLRALYWVLSGELRLLRRAGDRVLHALAEGDELRFGAAHGSLKDWAGELGVSHETLYLALAELEKRGRIVRGDGVLSLPPAVV